ncbi:MAG: response regulator [Saprospiraceae bacterium]|nr:response regulator [Saprospiraceae bacterium]
MYFKTTQYIILLCFILGTFFNLSYGQVDSLKKVYHSIPDGRNKADVLGDLAYAYFSIDADSCMKYADILYHYATAINYPKRVTGGLYYKGVAYYVKGDYDNAIKVLEEAIVQSNDVKDAETRLMNMVSVYNLMSNIYLNSSSYEKALEVYLENLKVSEEYGDTLNMAIAENGVGLVFSKIFDWENAKIHTQKSIYYFKAIDNKEYLANGYNSLSVIAQNIDADTSKRLDYLLTALDYALESDAIYYIGGIYDNLADYYQDRGNYKKAVNFSLKSLAISKQTNNIYNYSKTLVILGHWYTYMNKPDSALYYLESGINIVEKNNFSSDFVTSYLYYAAALSKNNQYKKAYEYMMKAHEHQDSTFNNQVSQQIEESAAKFEFEKNQRQIAEQELKIAQSKNTRNAIVFGALIFLIGIAAAYQYYLSRQRQKAKAAENALSLQQEEAARLRELDKLKSNFFTNLSHELRTPLTLILGPITDAIEQVKAIPLKNKLQIVQVNAQKLLNLVNEIMDLSKAEVGKLSINTATVALAPFTKRLFSAFQSMAEVRKIDFYLKMDIQDDLYVALDMEKFEKIINNLLANALKYTSLGGEMSLTVQEQGGKYIFEVADTGRGIHPDDQPHIFNRFYQAEQGDEPLQGGTGVGLALSKELTKLLGGDLSFVSTYQKGSIFTLQLPLESVEAPKSMQDMEIEEETTSVFVPTFQPLFINGEKPNILIVEDNIEMSRYLVEILSPNYQCTTANDGQEAIKQLKLYSFDCITSDVMMPNMDGFELRTTINENPEWKQIPFLLLTARHLEDDKIKGFQLGIDDYVTKPFRSRELQARIHNLISNKLERDNYKEEESFVVNTLQVGEIAKERKSVNQDFLKRCEEVVIKNMDNPAFRVDDFAKAMHSSSKQLGRTIKKLTGLSPVAFLLEVRLQKARELLEKGLVATVHEAQIGVGINSTSYFTHKFTARFGINPKEFRT